MATRSMVGALATLACTVALLAASPADAVEVKVMASNAIKEALVELAPTFEKASGHKVTFIWGGSESSAKRIADGEVVDVVIVGSANIDKLIADGKLVAGSRADFTRSGVGVAVRAGLPKPDISSGDAVKRAVLDAKSVGYSSGPSGFYIADLFKKMGIADQVKDKVKQPPSGTQIADLMARGEVDLGFQQISELVHAKGIHYLGPLPAEIQSITVFAAGLHNAAPAPEAARALVKFLTSPEAVPVIRKIGMEPG
jgi:molybdate transport system substrate-binding protein